MKRFLLWGLFAYAMLIAGAITASFAFMAACSEIAGSHSIISDPDAAAKSSSLKLLVVRDNTVCGEGNIRVLATFTDDAMPMLPDDVLEVSEGARLDDFWWQKVDLNTSDGAAIYGPIHVNVGTDACLVFGAES